MCMLNTKNEEFKESTLAQGFIHLDTASGPVNYSGLATPLDTAYKLTKTTFTSIWYSLYTRNYLGESDAPFGVQI